MVYVEVTLKLKRKQTIQISQTIQMKRKHFGTKLYVDHCITSLRLFSSLKIRSGRRQGAARFARRRKGPWPFAFGSNWFSDGFEGLGQWISTCLSNDLLDEVKRKVIGVERFMSLWVSMLTRCWSQAPSIKKDREGQCLSH